MGGKRELVRLKGKKQIKILKLTEEERQAGKAARESYVREREQIISVERRTGPRSQYRKYWRKKARKVERTFIFFLSWLFVGSNLQGFFLYFGEETDVQFLDLTDCETDCNTLVMSRTISFDYKARF